MGYAELCAISNYTFLRGASFPEELVIRADELGYAAIAITDECSLSGVVRAHMAARERNIQLLVGSEIRLVDGPRLVLLATDRRSYGGLCRLLSKGRRRGEKGSYCLEESDLEDCFPRGCAAIWIPRLVSVDSTDTVSHGHWLKQLFAEDIWMGLVLEQDGLDGIRLQESEALSAACGIARVACGAVELHDPGRRWLRDTLTAIRLGIPLAELGHGLSRNALCHLRPISEIRAMYPRALLDASLTIADKCAFSLDVLRYEYPDCLVPEGYTGTSWLRELTERGVRWRWPDGESARIRSQVERELALIAELRYEPYFLTVHDIVRYAQEQGILCQGRGSAANSVVCYCLGITEVNPARVELLFERFISRERNEPPDIDVDFEHERREEVIQYIYRQYGRDRAALAATVITYRPRSAIRDVGKALGFSTDQVNQLAATIHYWDDRRVLEERFAEIGFDPANPRLQKLVLLVEQLIGFPRHLSQHVGGFIISQGPLDQLVPIENAAMADRTVIQWEKDDLEELGLLKIDVLALGMLSAIRKSFDYIREYRGESLTMDGIAEDDPKVYNMIQQADTVGVFQIESRAQMSMLPRLKPRNYYDLVIEIAIVRPGPIQGDMVHPYLGRRNNPESVVYPSDELKVVLERTLGVPIFQEQVMQIAMVAADFSPGEADQLRRSMAAWKRRGGIEQFEEKLVGGMIARGYEEKFARQVFKQIKGFGDYGFPESHSASFALLAYVSSWLKYYEPAVFCCALLNSQPMGFYRPAQLVNDAVRHGVTVRPVDINHSTWDCCIEPDRAGGITVRLGFRMVKGLSEDMARQIVRERERGSFRDIQQLVYRCAVDGKNLGSLAEANALSAISGHRYRAYWDAAGVEQPTDVLGLPEFNEAEPMLPRPDQWDNTLSDYASTGLTLGPHPVALLRATLDRMQVCPAAGLDHCRNGERVAVTGLVINRQRPMTASGVVFMTLEDETGQANIVIWPSIVESQRQALLKSRLITVSGKLQVESGVIHLVAHKLWNCNHMVGMLEAKSRDFH